jgi:hypothetical protein
MGWILFVEKQPRETPVPCAGQFSLPVTNTQDKQPVRRKSLRWRSQLW